MQPAEAVVTVELSVDGEQIAGRVRSGDGPERPFSGWLQLLSAFQEVAGRLGEAEIEPKGGVS